MFAVSRLVVWITIALLTASDCVKSSGDFWDQADGKVVPNYVLQSLSGITRVECMLKCYSHSNCKSINFSERYRQCELNSRNSKDPDVTFEERSNWAFYEPLLASVENVSKNFFESEKSLNVRSANLNESAPSTSSPQLNSTCLRLSPCKHGTCSDVSDGPGYKCSCNDSYTGTDCDIAPILSRPPLNGSSCLDIRRKYTDRIPPSGMYWISTPQPEGPMQMYCDMEVDGGGWTQIANVNATSNDVQELTVSDDLSTLNLASTSPYYALSTDGLVRLRELIGFMSIRIYCFKPSVGRTVHLSTVSNSSGFAVVDYMTGASTTQPSSCGSYVIFPDDNSQLSRSCSSWKDGKWFATYSYSNEVLYRRPACIAYINCLNIASSVGPFLCDNSYIAKTGSGVWKFYVR